MLHAKEAPPVDPPLVRVWIEVFPPHAPFRNSLLTPVGAVREMGISHIQSASPDGREGRKDQPTYSTSPSWEKNILT
jgi:hypothetical protein